MSLIRNRIFIAVICAFIASTARAQDEPFVAFPKKFEGYLKALHHSKPGALAFDEKAARDVAGWRKAGRSRLGDLLGLSRMARELEAFHPTVTLGERSLTTPFMISSRLRDQFTMRAPSPWPSR